MEGLHGHAPFPRQHLRHRSQESERQTTRREKAAGEWQGNRGQHPARASATVKAHPGRSRARGLAARPRGKEYDMMKMYSSALRATAWFSFICLSLVLVSCQAKSTVSKVLPVKQPLPQVHPIQNG